jgi:glycosyltransferase involved in cell wall biosynthesis
MKIGINAVGLNPGKTGGSETYFRSLLHYLQKVDRDNSYSVLCAPRHVGEIALFNPSFRERTVPVHPGSAPGWLLRGALRRATGIDLLGAYVNRLDLDLIHHPFPFLNPRGLKVPAVLTFYDLQHEYLPEFFTEKQITSRRQDYLPSAREATRIIAISEHTKSCLVEKYEIDPGKIDVIHIGFGKEYGLIEDSARLENVRGRYGLNRPFMYYPAATWPHKNHGTLLRALRLLVDRHGFDGELVLTGAAFQAQDEIMEEIGRLGLKNAVRPLGYLPYEDLPCLFNLARVMVFPSLFEGFGIPVVEAMACGCPVACSGTTSLPEVVGDAAVMFEPLSAEDMAEKLWAIWNDGETLGRLRELGLQRAEFFSWEEMARKTIDVYRKSLENT